MPAISTTAALATEREPATRRIDHDALIRKVAWRLMPLIMVCYLFAFFDRINISFAKFQLQGALNLSGTAYGLGASLFVIGYVLFEVPSNLLLYKVGARRWIARIMISWGLATSAMVFVTTEWQFYALRFVVGAMEAGSYGLNFWAPHLIRSSGISSSTTIGLLTAVPYVFGAICMVVGRVSDANGERRKYVAGLLVAAALGFFAAGFFDKQTGLLIVALAVIGSGVVASIPAFWALPPRILTGVGAAGGIALINTLGQLGGIVSPVMVGRIQDATGSTTPALHAIGVASLVCALIVMKALPAAAMEAARER